MSAIRLIAFESRDPAKVFVSVPYERGRYVLTDRCVAQVACPHCQAMVGEPCKGAYDGRYNSGTHYARRGAARHLRSERVPDKLGDEDDLKFPPIDGFHQGGL